jgi:hypothetical protein
LANIVHGADDIWIYPLGRIGADVQRLNHPRNTTVAAIKLREHLNAVACDVKAPAEVFIGALEDCAQLCFA